MCSAEEGYVVNDMKHLETQCPVYGVFDTVDNCWVGDEQGPRLFTREDTERANGLPYETLARLSAQVTNIQLGYPLGRLVAREFNETDLVHKDDVPTKMTGVEAIQKAESGDY